MVSGIARKTALAALAAAVVLSLGACQVLFIGVFPPSAGQLSARADLSAAMSASAASSFSAATARIGGSDYVVLVSDSGFDPSQVHLVILDSHLKTLCSFTNAQILGTVGSYLGGTVVMADVSGNLVVGNARLVPSAGTFVLSGPTHTLFQPAIPGLGMNEADFGASGNFFTYTEWDSSWASSTVESVFLGAPSTSINFEGAFTDADSFSGPDVFVLQDYSSSQGTWILSIPKTQIDGASLTSYTSNVFATYAPYSISNVDSATVCYAQGSVIAYDYQDQGLVRFPLDQPGTISRLPIPRSSQRSVAIGPSGTWCVVWDPDTREIRRYEQWW